MRDLISVIIPVYNTEKYITECIRSVLEQTYQCIEILVIDDGSEDRSGEICRNMSKIDERICLIGQEHKGVSSARNVGVEKAKGEYLFFLDSDDVIHPHLLEELYLLLKKTRAGMASVTHYCEETEAFEKLTSWKKDVPEKRSIYLSCENAIKFLLYSNRDAMLHIMGGKLIRRDAVQDIRFDEQLTNGEDTLFIYQVIGKGTSVSVLCKDWYYHRKHEKGISKIFSVPTCQNRYKAYCIIRDSEMKRGRVLTAAACEKAILNSMIKWYKIGKDRRDKKLMDYVKELMRIEKETKVFSQGSWLEKIQLYLLFYCYLLHQILYIPGSWMSRKVNVFRRKREKGR